MPRHSGHRDALIAVRRYRRLVLAALFLGVAVWGQQPEVRTRSRAYLLAPPVITTETERVAVDVVARRPDGMPDASLRQPNFVVLDDGVLRSITNFSIRDSAKAGPGSFRPSNAPTPTARTAPSPQSSATQGIQRAVALFFDDVNTDGADLQNARNAASRFIREDLSPSDRVAVFTSSGIGEVDFTADPTRLLSAIAKLGAHPRSTRRSDQCPHITDFQAFQIANHRGAMALNAAVEEKKRCDEQNGIVVNDGSQIYNANHSMAGYDNPSEQVLVIADALWTQSRAAAISTLSTIRNVITVLGRQPGDRVLLLASGGFLSGTLETLQAHVVREALRDKVVINSLEARGLYTEGPGRSPDYVPDVMTLPIPTYLYEESSGLSEATAREEAMADLAQSTGGLFFHNNNDLTLGFDRLGLIPAVIYELTFAPGNIPHNGKYHKLKVEITPQSQDIIQARPGYFAPSPDAGQTVQAQMDAAMRATAADSALPVTVNPHPGAGKLKVDMRLDAAHLPFQDEKGRHRLTLHFIAGLFDPQGKFVTGKEAEMDLALKDPTWRRLVSQGLNTNLSLDAPAAAYTLRVVVATGPAALFAASLPLTIH